MPKRVAAEQVVVEERRAKVVRRGDCVQVAREVDVDVLHRQHLAIPAARSAALEAEDGTEARLTNGRRRPNANRGSGPGQGRPWSSSCLRRAASA